MVSQLGTLQVNLASDGLLLQQSVDDFKSLAWPYDVARLLRPAQSNNTGSTKSRSPPFLNT
jgi:hypothetical protein